MKSATARTAIVYDFDGTLARGNMQGHRLLADLGHEFEKDFWRRGLEVARESDGDEVLVYMWRIIEDARRAGKPVTSDWLRAYGHDLPLFDGLDTWFERINGFGEANGLAIEHYVVSSGLKEIIEGCPIAEKFKWIFASSYLYEQGQAVAPAVAINYTTKMQYLFRINKGIMNSWDRTALNEWIPDRERPIPFSRMIFIGDGETDIPAMKTVRSQGGEVIAVFGCWEEHSETINRLIKEDRARMVAPADYKEKSQLDVMVKGLLSRMALMYEQRATTPVAPPE